jgi:hypothetical protein
VGDFSMLFRIPGLKGDVKSKTFYYYMECLKSKNEDWSPLANGNDLKKSTFRANFEGKLEHEKITCNGSHWASWDEIFNGMGGMVQKLFVRLNTAI